MKLKFAFVALIAALFFSSCTNKHQQPNIIILYADDMGYGDLGIQNADSKIQHLIWIGLQSRECVLPMGIAHRAFALPADMQC
jgi:hypothetical protein